MQIYTKILQFFFSAINRWRDDWSQSLSISCAMFVIGCKRCLHVFSGETHGAPWHSVLRLAQERKANHVSSYVPSYRDANDIVGRYKILSRRPRYFYRYVRVRNNITHLDHLSFSNRLTYVPLVFHSFNNQESIYTYWLDTYSLAGIINSFVHIIMYTYYLLAALLPHYQYQRYLWWKKYITTLQMVRSKHNKM